VNKENPALDVYINVARDVHILSQFAAPQMAPWRNFCMQRGAWDSQVPSDVKQRFIENKYVVIQKFAVYLTQLGKDILEYKEDPKSGSTARA